MCSCARVLKYSLLSHFNFLKFGLFEAFNIPKNRNNDLQIVRIWGYGDMYYWEQTVKENSCNFAIQFGHAVGEHNTHFSFKILLDLILILHCL